MCGLWIADEKWKAARFISILRNKNKLAMSHQSLEQLRVLELYSGIGGMHWALKESGVPHEVVMAVDINTTANKIYQHNFPQANLNSFGIEKLTLKKMKALQLNAILMSPPCQPFSRVGKKGDCDDVRTKSFLHVLQLLQQMDTKPGYILVENVKGFEVSRTRQMLLDTLQACDYVYQEYLLSPLQFGIPNSRLRYYLIAKLRSHPNPLVESDEIFFSLPDSSSHQSQTFQGPPKLAIQSSLHSNEIHPCANHHSHTTHVLSHQAQQNDTLCQLCSGDSLTEKESDENESHTSNDNSLQPDGTYCKRCAEKNNKDTHTSKLGTVSSEENRSEVVKPAALLELMDAGRNMRYCEDQDEWIDKNSRPLSDFMEVGAEEKDLSHLLVSDKDLRQFVVMDVVFPQLKKSTCFTKRYGHYVEGAGSLVQMSSSIQDTRAASSFKSKAVELKNKHDWGEEELAIIRKLRLRYFSPREVANLLCFPPEFEFPKCVSDIQMYRCLGNSLNVHVVARLIRRLVYAT